MSDLAVFSAMQEGEPLAQYQKTILAQVCVQVLNPFRPGESEFILLTGMPGSETAIVKVWSVAEDVFFKRQNRKHFQNGNIIPFHPKAEVKEASNPIEQMSDEELQKVINQKFMGLQSTLNKINSVAPLFRMIKLAEEMEKSEKIIGAIRARLAEVQLQEYKPEQ